MRAPGAKLRLTFTRRA